MTDVINRANATIKMTGYNVTYNGAWHWATATVTGVNGVIIAGLNSAAHIDETPQ